mmetsp:Transcript_25578/g.55245  ORF Transcript_25578/g.55245 Transcript_25578/m.55245 type:complete len:365 (-) Transcript_25578:681-1775(-)
MILLDRIHQTKNLGPFLPRQSVLGPPFRRLVIRQIHVNLLRQHFPIRISLFAQPRVLVVVGEFEPGRVEAKGRLVVDVAETAVFVRGALVGVRHVTTGGVDVCELDGTGLGDNGHASLVEGFGRKETFLLAAFDEMFLLFDFRVQKSSIGHPSFGKFQYFGMNVRRVPQEGTTLLGQPSRKRIRLLRLGCDSDQHVLHLQRLVRQFPLIRRSVILHPSTITILLLLLLLPRRRRRLRHGTQYPARDGVVSVARHPRAHEPRDERSGQLGLFVGAQRPRIDDNVRRAARQYVDAVGAHPEIERQFQIGRVVIGEPIVAGREGVVGRQSQRRGDVGHRSGIRLAVAHRHVLRRGLGWKRKELVVEA